MADEISIVVRAEDQFSGVLGNFGNIITGIKSALDLAGDAFRVFTGFAMQGLDAIAVYERMSATMETLVAKEILMAGGAETMAEALAMSSDKAEQLLKWTQELAINSPFTTEGVNNALRMAMAYGFTVTEAQRLTEALIDFAAGSGATEYAMEAIARALGQISATGKVTGGDMLQLVNAGLPVVEILAEGFGVTTAKLMEMRSQGLLPATEAIEYITQYLETNFAGAAERQATTWAGLMGTFEDIKQMGLREFFGGLFETLQPVAVALSEFLQGPGMELLSIMGAKIGEALAGLAPLVDVIESFGHWLNFTKDPLEAFIKMLESIGQNSGPLQNIAQILFDIMDSYQEGGLLDAAGTIVTKIFEAIETKITDWVAGDGPQILSGKIINWINRIGEGEDMMAAALTAAGNMLTALANAFGLIDWQSITDIFDTKLADAIKGHDWTASGDAFGDMLLEALTGEQVTSKGSEVIPAIARAISDWFFAAAGVADWEEFSNTFVDILQYYLIEKPFSMISTPWIYEWTHKLGEDIQAGLREGINSIDLRFNEWVQEKIINPVKDFLGIASPSSVFADIGRDIVLGLIVGFGSMLGSLIAVVSGIVTTILNLFAPILDIFGIDIGGGTGGASGTSDLGSGTGTSTGGLLTGEVINNYYGPVYFMGAGEPGAYYDCPSPNPLMTAGDGGLVTTGFSGGT